MNSPSTSASGRPLRRASACVMPWQPVALCVIWKPWGWISELFEITSPLRLAAATAHPSCTIRANGTSSLLVYHPKGPMRPFRSVLSRQSCVSQSNPTMTDGPPRRSRTARGAGVDAPAREPRSEAWISGHHCTQLQASREALENQSPPALQAW